MKTCPNCGKQLNEQDTFCNNCGYDYNNTTSFELEEDKPKQEHQSKRFVSKANYGPNLFKDEDDFFLLDEYIGRNVTGMKSGFSWCTFFFSAIYMFYRKMWGLGIITLLFNAAISFFISNLYVTIGIYAAYHLIVGIVFKDLYLKKALRDIDKIQAKNPEASDEELALLVGNKGGVSNTLLIIVMLLSIVFIIFNIVAITSGFKSIGTSLFDVLKEKLEQGKESATKIDDSIREKQETNVVGNLYLILPKGFKSTDDKNNKPTDSSSYENKSNCTIKAMYVDSNAFGDNAKTYLDLKVKQTTVNSSLEYKDIKVSGQTWTMVKSTDTIPKFATYVILYNGKIYDVTFETNDEENTSCIFSSEITSTSFRLRNK